MALISCSECGSPVSDKAMACPHCGNPINYQPQTNTRQNGARRTSNRYRRLPNGYGSIRRMGGKRRKPYGAFPPVTAYKDNGTAITPKAIGYFETYNQAYECLTKFHGGLVSGESPTFKQVFEAYFEDKYVKNKKRVYSKSSVNSTNSAFNNLKALHNVQIKEIKTAQMQAVIDSCSLKHSSIEIMVMLLKQVFTYAVQHDYIQKNYAEFVKINIPDDDEKGVPFTEEEINLLLSQSYRPEVQYLLIMIFSGMRISELENVEIHKEERYLVGGVKTRAGKGRIIPIHNTIMPYIDFLQAPFRANTFRDTKFYPLLEELGLSRTPDGVKHTPHDCRHTFSWLADKYGMDSLSKHLIMGHSLKDLGIEGSIYGHRTKEELISEIDKIRLTTA